MSLDDYFATAALGTTDLLATELAGLGASGIDASAGGVAFQGTLETACRACLWSRVALHVLRPIASFPAPTPDALYEGVAAIDWEEHLGVDDTFVVANGAIVLGVELSHEPALHRVRDAPALHAKRRPVDQSKERGAPSAVNAECGELARHGCKKGVHVRNLLLGFHGIRDDEEDHPARITKHKRLACGVRGVLERLPCSSDKRARRLSERVERNRSRPRDLTEPIAHAQELSCAWRIGLDKRCELRFERCSNTRDHGSVLGVAGLLEDREQVCGGGGFSFVPCGSENR